MTDKVTVRGQPRDVAEFDNPASEIAEIRERHDAFTGRYYTFVSEDAQAIAKCFSAAHRDRATLLAEVERLRDVARLRADCLEKADKEYESLTAQLANCREAAREMGWLIETGNHMYWNGKHANSDGFVHNPNEAVRFARFEDSERIIHWLMQSYHVFLCSRQHVWIGGAIRALTTGERQ